MTAHARPRCCRPIGLFAAVLAVVLGSLGLTALPAKAADPPRLVAIRTANQGATDRVVFEFDGPLPSSAVVTAVDDLYADATGRVVPVAGAARLRLRFQLIDWFGPPAGGAVTAANVTEVRLVSSFEGVVDYGIGLRAPAAARVSTLTAPSRVVVDIDAATTPVDDPSRGRIDAVTAAGDVRWFQHEATATGAARWTAANFGNTVGAGFVAPQRFFAGGGGVIYGLDGVGNLRWYRHADPASGSAIWTVANFGAVVATGWTGVRTIVGMGAGVLYVVRDDGTVAWYRHRGFADGAATWAGPFEVGNGFDRCERLFRGDVGVLYCVRADGTLQYWRHLDVTEGSITGPQPWIGGNIIGAGWGGLQQVWGTPGGTIYAVDAAGQLHWFRHLGTQTGSYEWEVANFGAVIGTGWGGLATVLSLA